MLVSCGSSTLSIPISVSVVSPRMIFVLSAFVFVVIEEERVSAEESDDIFLPFRGRYVGGGGGGGSGGRGRHGFRSSLVHGLVGNFGTTLRFRRRGGTGGGETDASIKENEFKTFIFSYFD